MRILLAPVLDLPREDAWQGDSCYLWSLFMAEAASKRGWFTYWVLPEVYKPPELPHVKMLQYVLPEGLPPSNLFLRHGVPSVVMEHFQGPQGPEFVDAVVTNDVHLGMIYQQYFSARQFFEEIPVVSWNGYPTILDWKETNWVMEGDETPLYTRALGHALTSFVSCCPYCSSRSSELVQAYCSPQMIRRFMEKREEVMMCAECDLIDGLDEPKNEKFSLYWGGRFTSTKGGEKSVEQYIKLLMGGRDVEIYVTAVGGATRLSRVIKKYGAQDSVLVMKKLTYEQAQRVMKRCHVSVFYQLNPGAAAPYEQIYAGLIVLFKRYFFPEELDMYPPDYPFLFETDVECAAMLRWIYENYDEAQAKMKKVKAREWVKEKTDKMLGAGRILDIVEDRVPVKSYKSASRQKDAEKLVAKALKACASAEEGPVTLERLCLALNQIRGRAIVQTNWGIGLKGMMPMTVYRRLIPKNWRDDCMTEVPRFVKVK